MAGMRLGQRNGMAMTAMITMGKQHGRIKHIRMLVKRNIAGRGNTLDGAGLVCLENLGRGLYPAVNDSGYDDNVDGDDDDKD